MKIKYWIVILLFGFIACEESKSDLAILQNEEKLVDLITDLYIAESALNKQSISVRDSLTEAYRENIILIHDLSQEEFDTIIKLVQTDMENYSDIHRKVHNKLKELNSNFDKKGQ